MARSKVCPYRGCYTALFLVTLLGLLVPALIQVWFHYQESEEEHDYSRDYPLPTSERPKDVIITNTSPLPSESDKNCLYHTCFQVYQCGYNDDGRISIYIYPLAKYIDATGVPVTLPISKEYSQIVQTIANSVYFTSDTTRACLFLPPIDLLNQNHVRLKQSGKILASLPYWNDGFNHLLFNMLPGALPDFNTSLDVPTGKGILAGGGFDTWSYRRTFDVSIPVYNPLVANVFLPFKSHLEERQWLLTSTQMGLHHEYISDLQMAKESDSYSQFLIVRRCEGKFNYSIRCSDKQEYNYMNLLQESTFSLVIRGSRLGQPTLYDVLKAGSIPVVVADSYVLPFSEVLDWERALIRVSEDNLPRVLDIVKEIPPKKLLSMKQQVQFFFENYIQTMESITLTTLQIINDRVFPYVAKKFEEWNERPYTNQVHPPLFLPLVPPKQIGFTAVILTYDRLESLFRVIQQVAKAPSLAKVLVVWNNQLKAPPQAAAWPKINKPLKVVQTRYNKLSNRFYPYDEIETEAILALDDDILMLTTDELEFGYQVWREFSDRLVGYPSRIHRWDSLSQSWKYESEWTSNISMVLTGAAFYHKYYSYLYTNSLPGNIKAWVDDHMNCEDLAMNFLIANVTGKAPIKVAPRQKFKCVGVSECGNYMMLSADLTHMVERSECITRFSQIYKTMPLKTVEFRADPLLYKENISDHLKLHSDIGSL